MKGDILITEKIVLENTDYGKIKCCLRNLMNERNISIYQLSRLADIKYDIIERYYYNRVVRYDMHVLARICYSLDCEVNDILSYVK